MTQGGLRSCPKHADINEVVEGLPVAIPAPAMYRCFRLIPSEGSWAVTSRVSNPLDYVMRVMDLRTY